MIRIKFILEPKVVSFIALEDLNAFWSFLIDFVQRTSDIHDIKDLARILRVFNRSNIET